MPMSKDEETRKNEKREDLIIGKGLFGPIRRPSKGVHRHENSSSHAAHCPPNGISRFDQELDVSRKLQKMSIKEDQERLNGFAMTVETENANSNGPCGEFSIWSLDSRELLKSVDQCIEKWYVCSLFDNLILSENSTENVDDKGNVIDHAEQNANISREKMDHPEIIPRTFLPLDLNPCLDESSSASNGNTPQDGSVFHRKEENKIGVSSSGPPKSEVLASKGRQEAIKSMESFLNFSLQSLHSKIQELPGSSLVREILGNGSEQDVDIINEYIIDHVAQLITHPIANFVIQKLLGVCNEDHRMQIVSAITKEQQELVLISSDISGARVMQKLIETLKNQQQISTLVLNIVVGFHQIALDENGSRVLQKCLESFSSTQNQLMFAAAIIYCNDIAVHPHGCCVLQKCIVHSEGKYRDFLLIEICKNGLVLAQNSFGNLIIQSVIELHRRPFNEDLISQFEGHFKELAFQKFGSHVVESILKHCKERHGVVIQELLLSPRFDLLLNSPFANYVIKTALEHTEGILHDLLVEEIRKYDCLRNSPFCKMIFSKCLPKKR